jgi:hypothetical protein
LTAPTSRPNFSPHFAICGSHFLNSSSVNWLFSQWSAYPKPAIFDRVSLQLSGVDSNNSRNLLPLLFEGGIIQTGGVDFNFNSTSPLAVLMLEATASGKTPHANFSKSVRLCGEVMPSF